MVDHQGHRETIIFKIITGIQLAITALLLLILWSNDVSSGNILSAASGAATGLILFLGLVFSTRYLFFITPRKAVIVTVFYLFKFILIFLLVYVLFKKLHINGLYFAAGFTALPVAILTGTFSFAGKLGLSNDDRTV